MAAQAVAGRQGGMVEVARRSAWRPMRRITAAERRLEVAVKLTTSSTPLSKAAAKAARAPSLA